MIDMLDLDVKWFAFLAVQSEVLTARICRDVADALGANCNMLLFAETIITNELASVETVQKLIDRAWKKAQGTLPPPKDVFAGGIKPDMHPTEEKTKEVSFKKDDVIQAAAIDGISPNKFSLPTPATVSAPAMTPATVSAPATTPATVPTPKTIVANAQSNESAFRDVFTKNLQNFSLNFDEIEKMNDDDLKIMMIKLLTNARQANASDLHVSANARVFMRLAKKITFLSEHVLTAAESRALNLALLTSEQKETFLEKQDYDYALALDVSNRYRVNLMNHKDGSAGTYRLIPDTVKTLEELGFRNADVIRKLLDFHNGLILVTGPVGSGKTTTLAALMAELNDKRRDHIISVENPIEILHESNNCSVTQREVGIHTESFHTALKGALREDPDIIVIGELRDLETIEMAITAAETGHLVIGTLHTSDAATTLNRLLDVFPPSQQPQIRAMTAESLRGIICQRLVPTVNGELTVACELLLNNLAVGNLVREGKAHALRAVLETGTKQGMCMMDHYLLSLFQDGIISEDTANDNIVDRAVKNRIHSYRQFGDAAAQAIQTSLPGQKNAKKKWGLFN